MTLRHKNSRGCRSLLRRKQKRRARQTATAIHVQFEVYESIRCHFAGAEGSTNRQELCYSPASTKWLTLHTNASLHPRAFLEYSYAEQSKAGGFMVAVSKSSIVGLVCRCYFIGHVLNSPHALIMDAQYLV